LLPQFGPTSLALTIATYATNNAQPELFITRSPTGVRATWPLGFPDWTLQSATNVTAGIWTLVPVQCDNQAVIPITMPRQFFRLKQ